jgi:hypothetical protein
MDALLEEKGLNVRLLRLCRKTSSEQSDAKTLQTAWRAVKHQRNLILRFPARDGHDYDIESMTPRSCTMLAVDSPTLDRELKGNHMTIEQRIGQLERTNKRYRWAIFAVVAVVGAAICIGMVQDGRDDELILRKLTIQDDKGRDRIVMHGAFVRWFDSDGKLRIVAETLADGQASVRVNDANGKTRIATATTKDNKALTVYREYDANGSLITVKTLP